MVQLILSSAKGNQGGKYFPYLGFLGLTPVRVEGIVRTKLDADLKLLPATSLTISVRCYEQRLGRVNVTNSRILVDHTQVLWLKPDDVEYEPIGVREYPFRIILPANVAGFSTATFVDYRCTWRVEAVLTHIPIAGVGSRQIRHFEIPLTRFDLAKHPPCPAKSPVTLDQCSSKPRAPRVRYSFEAPSRAVGPCEPVSIRLHLQPLEPNVVIKNASVLIERRIQLLDPQQAPSSSPIPIPNSPFHYSSPSSPANCSPSASPRSSPPLSSSHSSYFSSTRNSPTEHTSLEQASTSQHSELAQSTASLVSSQPTITPNNVNPSTASLFSWTSDSPLLHSSSLVQHQNQTHPPQTPPMTASSATASSSSSALKVVINPIVGKETDSFTREPSGLWSSTISLEWPASKSHSRWAVGETISSDLVSVKYFIRVKILVTSPGNGTDTIELGEKELLVVSTSEQDRQNAQATYAELVESGRVNDSALRSKSKSPRRLKPIERGDVPPSPAPYRGEGASTPTTRPTSSSRAKAPRRPHTSAGPRDKSSFKQANGDPHKKRRSEAGWGAMGLPIAGMSEGGGSNHQVPPPQTKFDTVNTNGEISKKSRSSSGGKLSSTSFWAVSAPPLKNHSSSSSSGGKSRSTGALGTSSGTSTTSSADEDDEEIWRQRAASMSARNGKSDGRGYPRPPPSSFNPAIVSQAEGGGRAASVREWEEELARIEEKSRKESDATGFGRMRKRSFVSTMRDLLPSRNKVFNFGAGDESSY